MAFIPSNNILDKDTHNMLVKSFVDGGIGYTEDDGTVHKISGDYVEGGGSGGGGAFIVTLTAIPDSDEYTADKTFAETKTAYDGGSVIIFKAPIGDYLLSSLGTWDGTAFEAHIIGYSGDGEGNMTMLMGLGIIYGSDGLTTDYSIGELGA